MFKRIAVAAALVLCLASCAAEPATPPDTAPVAARAVQAEDCRPNVAVVGDSITSWAPAFAFNPALTWVTTATSLGMVLEGGWAVPGANLGQMRDGVQPSPGVCYLVLMGGTNDIVQNVPMEQRLAAIDEIVATVDADQVVISAVAPLNLAPTAGLEWNAALDAYAARHGFVFIDPWEDFRADSGEWVGGGSIADGVHPVASSASFVGARIFAHLERLDEVREAPQGEYPVAF